MFPFKPQSLGEAKWAKQLCSTREFEVKHLLYTESNACRDLAVLWSYALLTAVSLSSYGGCSDGDASSV